MTDFVGAAGRVGAGVGGIGRHSQSRAAPTRCCCWWPRAAGRGRAVRRAGHGRIVARQCVLLRDRAPGRRKVPAALHAIGTRAAFPRLVHRYGMVTVFISALLPIPFLPFKVFCACAGAMGVSRTRFMLVLAAARIPRYAGLAYLGANLGEHTSAWIQGHDWHMGAVASRYLAALYGLLKWNDRAQAPRHYNRR